MIDSTDILMPLPLTDDQCLAVFFIMGRDLDRVGDLTRFRTSLERVGIGESLPLSKTLQYVPAYREWLKIHAPEVPIGNMWRDISDYKQLR